MGSKRPSTRTLPSGRKVTHFPDGTQRLIPENKAAAFLAAIAPEVDEQLAALDEQLVRAVEDKRAALDAGDAVPHDKRPI